jgi:hypothetical protein
MPFRHWIVDGLFDPTMLRAAEDAFDGHANQPGWVRYDNEFERKMAFNQLDQMPDPVRACIYEWNTASFAKQIGGLTGIVGLSPDPRMWGGGMHVMQTGGYLKPHLDHSHNPNGLERRLSMIVFLNSNWHDDWGGAFELWSNAGHWPIKKVPVKFNRTVIFEAGPTAWHGVPMAISCPSDTMRKTIALYYLATPRDGIVRRARAEFAVPFATPALVAEARKRAMPLTEDEEYGTDE